MSELKDAARVKVGENPSIPIDHPTPTAIAITAGGHPPDISIVTPDVTQVLSVITEGAPSVTLHTEIVKTVGIEAPGLQGPPGLQNVYIQPIDPAVEHSWGTEQTNFIWIQS